PDGTGYEVEALGVGTVQAALVNIDLPTLHIETVQGAAIHNRRARGQGGMAGVDKTATVTGDTVGVSKHDICAPAAHFHIAIEEGRIGTDDFVKNQASGAAAQVRVTLDVTTELGLRHLLAVVENDATVIDVEVVVEILRHAAA